MIGDSVQPGLQALRAILGGFGAFRKRTACLEGTGRFALTGIGALLVWFLADWIIGLPGWILLPSFFVALGTAAFSAPIHGVRPWLHRVDLEAEALTVEALKTHLDNQVIGSLQLAVELDASERGGAGIGHSPLLVRTLVAQTVGFLEAMDLRRLVDLTRAKRLALGGAGVAALALLLLFAAPGAVRERGTRLREAYAGLMDALFPVTFHVEPGDKAVVRGRSVLLGLRVEGARRDRVTLLRFDERGDEGEGPAEAVPLTLVEGRVAFPVPLVEATFAYEFEYGARRTARYTITAGDLPEINAINYELTFPAYTGTPPRIMTGRVPKLQGLSGTNVLVSFASSTPLHPDYCRVEWQNGPRQPISVNGRFGHFSFAIEKPDRATIKLVGDLGPDFASVQPLSFEVAAERDAAPTVDIRMKRRSFVMLAEQAAAFGFEYIAEDDFGVAETALVYKIDAIDEMLGRPTREATVQRRVEPPRDRVIGKFEETFKALDPPLRPGDRITITMTARDNNTETGPGLARCRPVEIVVVAPDLGVFSEKSLAFGTRGLLGGLSRVKRQTNLMIEPKKTVRTEAPADVEKKKLKARVGQESWPSGSEDMVGQYFQVLSGGK